MGGVEMAVSLDKNIQDRLSANLNRGVKETQRPLTTSVSEIIKSRIFDEYCSISDRTELISIVASEFKMDGAKAAVLVDIEIEILKYVNEFLLCEELKSLMHRFTDNDKKLDNKERSDAIQIVCRSRVGFTKGLSYDVAERVIIDFCRQHGVKVKAGLFRWAIP